MFLDRNLENLGPWVKSRGCVLDPQIDAHESKMMHKSKMMVMVIESNKYDNKCSWTDQLSYLMFIP